VIDEEQKFGVKVKDRLKELKHSVDVLTLTATPIPRTLHFSLMGARDLSIIANRSPNRNLLPLNCTRSMKKSSGMLSAAKLNDGVRSFLFTIG